MPSNRTTNPFVILQGLGKPVLPSVQGLRINISNLSHFQFKNKYTAQLKFSTDFYMIPRFE